ncbi:MAG TPA: amidohydrolase family protein [Xanthobacteraceae bacterium]|nr:amidohydrolase family protein [Xanthobacteraceae bacterium]
MLKKPNCPVIAIEEHYWDRELSATYTGVEGVRNPEMMNRLFDLGDLRIKEMDEAGVDVQLISHGAPSAQKLTTPDAVAMVRRVNDRLAAAIARHPTRFAGFATLPTSDPAAAADELERMVTEHGFKGAMIHGLANGVFLDDARFWPIFARAEKLDVPIYLHPALPHPQVMEVYYKEYAKDFPMVIRAAWGFTVETATIAIRLVLSGLFEKHPRLKIVLGHLGETLPFLVWRIDQALSRPGTARPMHFRDIFCNNFWITTSGNFSNPALLCCAMEMGVDRILFAIDWPFVPNPPGTRWMESVPLCDEDKAKILSGNAKRLFRM